MNPRELKAGDFYDREGGDYYLVPFVNEVRETGPVIDMMFRDSSAGERYPNHRFYRLLAGHRSVIPFSDKAYWNKECQVKLGSVPSLVGKRSTYVGSPMCSECGELSPFVKSKRGLCILRYVRIEKP